MPLFSAGIDTGDNAPLAAAQLVATISITIAGREPDQFFRGHGPKSMSPYRPSILTGFYRHALQDHPVVGLDIHVCTERMLCSCFGGRVCGLISPTCCTEHVAQPNMLYRIFPT